MNAGKVKVNSLMAKWRIEDLQKSFDNSRPAPFVISDVFDIGIFKWIIKVKFGYSRESLLFFLKPHDQKQQPPPVARFFFRVSAPATGAAPYVSPVYERELWTTDDHDWIIPDGDAYLPWLSQRRLKNLSSNASLQYLSRMLKEDIHADITINTTDGSLKAHKAILASCSPVLDRMFAHDLKEKESSVIELNDASTGSLSALLHFVYGTIKWKEFWKHRTSLMKMAHKYEIVDLKECCEDCLLEDLNADNVFERLQDASMYQLSKLKSGCLSYLFEFWKIDELGDEMRSFFCHADRELLFELLHSVVTVCKWV